MVPLGTLLLRPLVLRVGGDLSLDIASDNLLAELLQDFLRLIGRAEHLASSRSPFWYASNSESSSVFIPSCCPVWMAEMMEWVFFSRIMCAIAGVRDHDLEARDASAVRPSSGAGAGR